MRVKARTKEEPIYTWEAIRESLRKYLPNPPSKTTFKHWRKLPPWDSIPVGSMSNEGGGFGFGAHTFPSTLAAICATWPEAHEAHVTEVRRQAVAKRWPTDTSSGSVI